jgi:hypothetical protein
MTINHSIPIYKCPRTRIHQLVYLGSKLEALQSLLNDRIDLKQFSASWVFNEFHVLKWVSCLKLIVSLCDRFGVITAASLGIFPIWVSSRSVVLALCDLGLAAIVVGPNLCFV